MRGRDAGGEALVRVELKYGGGTVTFDAPEESVGAVVRAAGPVSGGAVPPLAERVRPRLVPAESDCHGRNVLVLLADGTRGPDAGAGYAALTPLLRRARSVRVLLATGTHATDTPDNWRLLERVRAVSGRQGIPLASAGAHDCRASEVFLAGATERGNAVRLHPLVRSADALLIVSDMMPHYFAGYSNATKYLLPGVAAYDAAERNHALALDLLSTACRHPLHPDPDRRRNPVAEDQLDAARLVTGRIPTYALATVGGGPGWATFAPLEEAVAEGISVVDARLVRVLDRRFRHVVVSCGGYPCDETLYIAQRSLELTREAFADGAEVLWLAECRNGIASSERTVRNFFTPLTGDARAYVRRMEERYVMFGHKTVRFVRLLDRLRALHVASALPSGTLPKRRMRACPDPQTLVREWARRREEILFVDDASRLALRLRGSDRPTAAASREGT